MMENLAEIRLVYQYCYECRRMRAATACDSCIYLAKYKGMKELYPFDLEQMDKEAYKKFSQLMNRIYGREFRE